MKIISKQPEFTFDDILILPGKSDFSIDEENKNINLKTKISKNIELKLPIIASPMPGVTEDQMAIAIGKMGGIGFIHHFQDEKRQLAQIKEVKKHNLKVAACISDLDKDLDNKLKKMINAGVDLISLETAHAHNTKTLKVIRKIKKTYPKVDLSVALIVTPEATEAVIKAGADSVRIGIGGGSHCTTRLVTGVGRPQLSALLACSRIAHKYNIPVISDTGIKYPGDLAKAIAFGADSIMIGGMFTATKESPGEIIKKNGKKYKMTWGMCTDTAMQKKQFFTSSFKNPKTLFNSLKHPKTFIKQFLFYFLNIEKKQKKLFEEGVEKMLPYKGSVYPILENLKNGLMRSMWYIGAHNLNEIKKKSKIVLTSNETKLENIPRI